MIVAYAESALPEPERRRGTGRRSVRSRPPLRLTRYKVTEQILPVVGERLRMAEGRNPQHSAGLIDSPTVKRADTVGASPAVSDTLLPWRTARAAASRTSPVMWFRVPSSSWSPYRPQFDSALKYPSRWSYVGTSSPAVIPASTPIFRR